MTSRIAMDQDNIQHAIQANDGTFDRVQYYEGNTLAESTEISPDQVANDSIAKDWQIVETGNQRVLKILVQPERRIPHIEIYAPADDCDIHACRILCNTIADTACDHGIYARSEQDTIPFDVILTPDAQMDAIQSAFNDAATCLHISANGLTLDYGTASARFSFSEPTRNW